MSKRNKKPKRRFNDRQRTHEMMKKITSRHWDSGACYSRPERKEKHDSNANIADDPSTRSPLNPETVSPTAHRPQRVGTPYRKLRRIEVHPHSDEAPVTLETATPTVTNEKTPKKLELPYLVELFLRAIIEIA